MRLNVMRYTRRWILAQYDVDVFDYESNSTVDVNSAPMNEGVDIPEFDYSRKDRSRGMLRMPV